MRREWEPEELVACWTLVDEDWRLVANKTGATRLGFTLLLKFFEVEARFPRHPGEVPTAAVEFVAAQVKVDPALFEKYSFVGRTIEYHTARRSAAHSTSARPRWATRTSSRAGWRRRFVRSS